jgi:cell division protein FtsQ
VSRRPARRYYGTARNAPTRPVVDGSSVGRLPWRFAIALVVVFAVCWAVDRAWIHLTTAPAFEVRVVELRGVVHADPDGLRGSAGVSGHNIFTLDLDRAREGLLAESWVEDARLRRRLPDGVLVEITEKTPAALERRGEGLTLLDGEGAELQDGVAPGRFELPMLEGAATQDARARAARVLTAVRERAPELWQGVESLDAGRSDRLVLRAQGHPPIWLAGPDSVDELMRWVENAARLQRELGRPVHVDARWRDRLYLGREHG